MAEQKSVLSVADICRILKACGEASVTELKFGDLHVRRDSQSPAAAPSASVEPAPAPPPTAEIVETQRKESERAQIQAEVTLRQQQLSQMLIEDPLEAERLLSQGDLIDDAFDEDDEEA